MGELPGKNASSEMWSVFFPIHGSLLTGNAMVFNQARQYISGHANTC